ncbi:hypothetical protein HMPREF0208_02108 [Citrobacter koseri]|nr:hypothetical protein HMPREF3207_03401 [Citrobacter koseri]KXB44153.1 hypothetical protein HMPREF0208_02108 [Citrobacter koseri]
MRPGMMKGKSHVIYLLVFTMIAKNKRFPAAHFQSRKCMDIMS